MNEREKIIQLWFEMWLTKQDLGIDNIFTEDFLRIRMSQRNSSSDRFL